MRIRILLLTVLLFGILSSDAQSYLDKTTKKSGYIVVNTTVLLGLDAHESFLFLENINSLNSCTENLSDSCFLKNGFYEFDDIAAHSIYFCCIYNTISIENVLTDSLSTKLKKNEILESELVPDSIEDKLNIERYRMRALEKIKTFTLLKDYTQFSYKNRKYRTISYYLICKADVYYCDCSRRNEFSTAKEIALVKIENVQVLSKEEIMKFDIFFKKFHKTKNYRRIKLPFSVTDKK